MVFCRARRCGVEGPGVLDDRASAVVAGLFSDSCPTLLVASDLSASRRALLGLPAFRAGSGEGSVDGEEVWPRAPLDSERSMAVEEPAAGRVAYFGGGGRVPASTASAQSVSSLVRSV